MAEAEYTTTTRVPIDRVWDFVQEMDNWGRFVTGYQKHEKQDETHSTWTLKGDVGVLSRTLTFKVVITEWNGPGRVAFTLDGVNEPMKGEGTFTLSSETGERGAWPTTSRMISPLAFGSLRGTMSPRRNVLFRLLESFWRWLLHAPAAARPRARRARRARPPPAIR